MWSKSNDFTSILLTLELKSKQHIQSKPDSSRRCIDPGQARELVRSGICRMSYYCIDQASATLRKMDHLQVYNRDGDVFGEQWGK